MVVVVGRNDAVLTFPIICPACTSALGRRIIPQSPEVETFRCGECAHEWSEPAPPVAGQIPERALPWDWLRKEEE
jgi:hypothetical protein